MNGGLVKLKMVIDLLTEKKESLKELVKFLTDEVTVNKKALDDIHSKEFIERNKDRPCWSDDWTIHDFIRVNTESWDRSISICLREIAENSEYISQINKAIDILKGV